MTTTRRGGADRNGGRHVRRNTAGADDERAGRAQTLPPGQIRRLFTHLPGVVAGKIVAPAAACAPGWRRRSTPP